MTAHDTLTGMKVLLVDDGSPHIEMLRDELLRLQCEVVGVIDAAVELVGAVAAAAPDIIIIDAESPQRDTLERDGPQQWPFPAGATTGRARLFDDRVFATPNGRARFAAVAYRPVAEDVDARFPFRLSTGRLRDQWHGMSRTGTLGRLFGHQPEPSVELHPVDLARRGLAAGTPVRVRSRRGSFVLPVQASDEVGVGQAFIAMHWGEAFVSGRDRAAPRRGRASNAGTENAGTEADVDDALVTGFGVNSVTLDIVDPRSRQPELKHAAVAIEDAGLVWRYVGFGIVAPELQLHVRQRLRQLMTAFGYASCVPLGYNDVGCIVLFRAAAATAVSATILETIEAQLGLHDGAGANLRYDDPRRGARRRIRLDDGRLCAASLSGAANAVASEAWLRDVLGRALPSAIGARELQMPGAARPATAVVRGATLCVCFDVPVSVVAAKLANGATLAGVQGELKCGTNCGSCLPELRRMAASACAGAAPSTNPTVTTRGAARSIATAAKLEPGRLAPIPLETEPLVPEP